MTKRKFEVGDVVVEAGSSKLSVIIAVMDRQYVWICPPDCETVNLAFVQDLVFISEGGANMCSRLQKGQSKEEGA